MNKRLLLLSLGSSIIAATIIGHIFDGVRVYLKSINTITTEMSNTYFFNFLILFFGIYIGIVIIDAGLKS